MHGGYKKCIHNIIRKVKEGNQLGDLDGYWMIILKRVLKETGCRDVGWIRVIQDGGLFGIR
jgi:hypothetical protein